MAGNHRSCPAALKPYQFVESLFEVLIRHGVNDGVDQRVEVTQPGENVKQLGVKAGLAYRH